MKNIFVFFLFSLWLDPILGKLTVEISVHWLIDVFAVGVTDITFIYHGFIDYAQLLKYFVSTSLNDIKWRVLRKICVFLDDRREQMED